MNLTIAVIAKECLPGRVKTRLCPPLTPVQAAGLAQVSLSQTLETVRLLPAALRFLVMEGTPGEQDASGFRVLPQATGGLDERLAAICDLAGGPLLIIGMDTPQLDRTHVEDLLTDWASPAPFCDAWLGPASDGGFWALAMRDPRGEHIRGVPMSTDRTGAIQLDRLINAGLNVGVLPRLDDVDTFDDARTVAALAPATAFAAAVEVLSADVAVGSQP